VKEKNKASFCQLIHRCGSSDEYDLWCIFVTSFCLFCVVEHHGSKITFHHYAKEILFYFSTNISAFLRYIGLPETDMAASRDSVSHLIYRVFR